MFFQKIDFFFWLSDFFLAYFISWSFPRGWEGRLKGSLYDKAILLRMIPTGNKNVKKCLSRQKVKKKPQAERPARGGKRNK